MNRQYPDITESVRDAVADTIALFRHTQAALMAQESSDELQAYPEARSAVESARRTLDAASSQLEGELEALGGASAQKHVRQWAAQAVSPAAEAIGPFQAWPVASMIRKDVVALSSASISLTGLQAVALARSVESVAATANRQLVELTERMRVLATALPAVVVGESELREPVASARDARERAERRARRAWGTSQDAA